jgi:phage terminase small subunit
MPGGRKPTPPHLRVIVGGRKEQVEKAERTLKAQQTCGAPKAAGKRCARKPGWGTDHTGTGPCRDHEPKAPAGDIRPPGADAVVRAALGEVARIRQVNDADRATAFQLGLAYQYAVRAGKDLAEALSVPGEKGGMKKHPAFQIWRDSQAAFRQWAVEFGLTPAASMRVQRPETEELSELEELLRDA